MRKFLIRLSSLFILPMLIIVSIYAILDPFRVVKHYDDYYGGEQAIPPLNEGHISLQTYETYKDTYHYDSFIFGNSRSRVYEVEAWMKHLPAEASPFHFYALSESLYGMMKKLQYLDEHEAEINNALFIVDENLLKQDTNLKGHLFAIPPKLVNYSNFTSFHFDNLRAFLDFGFIKCYIKYLFTGKPGEYLYFESGYTARYNEDKNVEADENIEKGTFYDTALIEEFISYSRDSSYISEPAIKTKQQEMLNTIKSILEKHNTDYRFIISPLYDQHPINPSDLAILNELFSEEKVFNFSGKNEFTDDFHNFYEPLHYRPTVATAIMDIAY